MFLTHPDYLASHDNRAVYASFLERLAADDTAWHALPSEVSDWWRRRNASGIAPTEDGWVVTGPAAAEATVVVIDRPSRLAIGAPVAVEADEPIST